MTRPHPLHVIFWVSILSVFAGSCQAGNEPAAERKPAAKGTGRQQPAAAQAPSAGAREFLVYVGTYTSPEKSKGIYVLRMNPATGELSAPQVAAEAANPSFLALHPGRLRLYAVGEMADFQGEKTGAVSAFAIDPASGKLTMINQQPSGGAGPCHVSVDKSCRNVLVANYGGGTVARFPARPADGQLVDASRVIQLEGQGPNEKRQEAPHAHYVSPDPSQSFALACDLGTDQVMVWRFDPIKGLIPNDPPSANVAPGAGPRHLDYHPSGKFVYVNNELNNTVTAFAFDADEGSLTEIHTVPTLPKDFTGDNSTAEIAVHPSGKFVYCSNRGHDSIAIFTVDESTGQLTPAGHQPTGGKTPRNFAVDPTGTFLIAANQNSDNLVVFKIDPKSGKLTPTGAKAQVPTPVCITFLPVGS